MTVNKLDLLIELDYIRMNAEGITMEKLHLIAERIIKAFEK